MSENLGKWPPPAAPARATLPGRLVRLEPLQARLHAAALWCGFAPGVELWRYMAYGPFASEAAFTEWLAGREVTDDPLTFVILRAAGGQAVGLLSLMAVRPDMGVLEIGNIVLSPVAQKTRLATEAFFLVLDKVFALGYRRVEWKCDARNGASRRAAQRLGFRFEGLFHQHMIVKGENRDTSWFAMLDQDWMQQRAAFIGWLADSNFDAEGRQRRPLASFEPDGVAG